MPIQARQGPESGVFGLGGGPQAIEQFGRRACGRLPEMLKFPLDVAIAAREAIVCAAEGRLRIGPEVPRKVDDREQQVAQLGFLSPGVAVQRGAIELCKLFFDLGARSGGIGPVEAGVRRARAELSSPRERRQPDRNVREGALCAARSAFLALHAIPGTGLVRGIHHDGSAENVRVAAHQLVADRVHHVIELERPALAREPGVKNHLEEQIAEFVPERRQVGAFNRIGNLVGFLDRVRCDRAEVLLEVPGAPNRKISFYT